MYHPIGIFDSGYGGLTVLRDIVEHLPQYDYLYLGDNARAPYGDRSFETVYQYTLQCVNWLLEQGCPLVILACNTASAKALRSIQQKDLLIHWPDRRVLGVIRPTSEVIGGFSQTGHVGILGTKGTVKSDSYVIEIGKFSPGISVTQQACPLWVPMIENDEYRSEAADLIIAQYVETLLTKDPKIDTILLACTHYPIILEQISKHAGSQVKIVQQGDIIAASLKDYLNRHPAIENRLTQSGSKRFYTTGDTKDFNTHGAVFFGQHIDAQHVDIS